MCPVATTRTGTKTPTMTKLTVDIWSDIACPWCYVGKRRLESALERFEHREHVEVTWRAFELKPDAPPVESSDIPYVQRLATKYGTTVEQAQSMIDHMTESAAADGLDFRFDRIQPGNTFDAHRLLHLASAHGRQDAMKERLLRAYMTEGARIGEHDVLVRLAADVGLPQEVVRTALSSEQFTDEVRQEETDAQLLGISGVPFFVFGRRYAVSGAQPAEVLLGALKKAWGEAFETAGTYAEGAVCGPDGCR